MSYACAGLCASWMFEFGINVTKNTSFRGPSLEVWGILPSFMDFLGAIPIFPKCPFSDSLEGPPGTEFGLVAYQKHRKVCGRVASYVSVGQSASWAFHFGINATKTCAAMKGTSTMNPILAN